MPLPEYYFREAYPFEITRRKFKEKTGTDLCDIVKKGFEQIPTEVERLAQEGDWKGVRTEINRLRGYGKLLGMCERKVE